MLNVQYAVVFAAVFSTLYSIDSTSKINQIKFLFPENDFVLYTFCLLLFYFFLDWLTILYIRSKLDITFSVVYITLWSFAIWAMGFLLLIIKFNHDSKSYFISLYLLFISFYYIYFYKTKKIGDSSLSYIGLFFSVIIFIMALIVMYITFLPQLIHFSSPFIFNESEFIFVIFAFLFVLKVLHFFNVYMAKEV